MKVRTQGSLLKVRWIDGPDYDSISDEIFAQAPGHPMRYQLQRWHSVGTFRAALLHEQLHRMSSEVRWRNVWPYLRPLSVDAHPLPSDVQKAGEVLAILAGFEADALVDPGASRGVEIEMARCLSQIGEDTLAAALHPNS